MLERRKHRTFDLQARLDKERGKKEKRIQFDRLPRKKVRPFWWSVIVFLLVIIAYIYLQKF